MRPAPVGVKDDFAVDSGADSRRSAGFPRKRRMHFRG